MFFSLETRLWFCLLGRRPRSPECPSHRLISGVYGVRAPVTWSLRSWPGLPGWGMSVSCLLCPELFPTPRLPSWLGRRHAAHAYLLGVMVLLPLEAGGCRRDLTFVFRSFCGISDSIATLIPEFMFVFSWSQICFSIPVFKNQLLVSLILFFLFFL